MSLPIDLMRKQTNTFFQWKCTVHQFWLSWRKAFTLRNIQQMELRVIAQKIIHASFIFQFRESTGRIKHGSTRLQQVCCLIQDLPLHFGKHLRSLTFPRWDHMSLFPEHSLTGAWSIDQDLIKIFMKIPVQLVSHLTGHQNIGETKYFQILQQSFCPGCAGIVGDQQALMAKLCTKLRCFSTRSRTQIQYPFSRLHRKDTCRRHGTWLLNIIKTCIVIRMLCRRILFCIIISVGSPWYSPKSLEWADPLKFLDRNLGSIDS